MLWVVNDRPRFGTSADNNKPLMGHTYMLFRIESREQRDDMDGLTDISRPFNDAINARQNGEEERAKILLNASIMAVGSSADLTRVDKNRLPQAMIKEFYATPMGTPTRGGPTWGGVRISGEIPYLNKAMQRVMPVEEAFALGEPTFEEIFGRS